MRVLDGLSFKQASATLAIALTLGLGTSVYELASDYRAMHGQVRETIAGDMQLVRGLAVEAAYQLSQDLAGEVVSGLHQQQMVGRVKLVDNYGGLLGWVERPAEPTMAPLLAERLFGDIADHRMPLEAKGLDGHVTAVGHLELRLDTAGLLNTWLDRILLVMVSGAAKAVMLCALVVAVFYAMITKPLLRITGAIAHVDPARPGARLIDLPRNHDRDELGLLVGTVNSLLSDSQAGLDGRDAAEGELAALNRELEQRVEDRTAELAARKEQLEKANRFINDGIRYASRIQNALLPGPDALEGLVDELAVTWQPLDIVGGDYYWMGTFGSKAVIAVMDCTGHGVPGAFMTAVVASSFSRILHHDGHDDPAAMLTRLNRLVKTALRQDRDGAVSNDGLDAAICVIDRQAGMLTYAGANLPLMVAEHHQFTTLRGNRMSLGYVDSPPDYAFTAHTVRLTAGQTFYLYTDGLTDQVGGPRRQLFGRKRLQAVLAETAGQSLDSQKDILLARLAEWRGVESRRDDMTFLSFRVKG